MSVLSPIESQFASTEEAKAYDVWFRAKVERPLVDTRPPIPYDEALAQVKATIDRKRKKAG